MKKNNKTLYFIIVAVLGISGLIGCSGGGGGGGTTGAQGKNSVVAAVQNSAPLSTCPNNGITVTAGIDTNGNGVLDPSEVTSTQYVCNGTDGTNGTNGISALVSTTTESAGLNCTYGGSKVNVGLDTNKNNILDSTEIVSSAYVCNGAAGSSGTNGTDGTNGTNGFNTLVSIVTEPAGSNCSSGGLKVSSGLDNGSSGGTARDGILQSGETVTTTYVCNGPGTVVIESILANPAVVRPGQSTNLSVSATDGIGSALTYSWSGSQGIFSQGTTSAANWTAPDSVGSYLVNVLVSNGISTVTGYASILVSVSPSEAIITDVSPAEARTGDTITITGAGFGTAKGSSAVTIGGVSATAISTWSENQIKAMVPSGAITGTVVVTVGGAASSPGYLAIPWSDGNLQLTSVSSHQYDPKIVSDGKGGAIVIWQDERNGNKDIYAQRVSSAGIPLWTTDGIAICTAAGDQTGFQLVSDGSGGAIIAWQDSRNGNNDIYAQRVSSAGTVQWPADGVAVSTAALDQSSLQLISDGSGGAIIAWQDNRSGVYVIYAQRVNSAGAAQWTADGIAASVNTAVGWQYHPKLVSDGSGGALIAWEDYRSMSHYDIYAQRVNSAGTLQWKADAAVSPGTYDQTSPQLLSDGSGGAIITWVDSRYGSYDIYAQRVGGAGTAQWTPGGVVVCGAGNQQMEPQIIADGSGGAIITWEDSRNSWFYDIYAQRVNSAGIPQWTIDGVAICTAASDQYIPQLVPDGKGGAIITWQDNRNGNFDIYAQRVASGGMTLWPANGISISAFGASGDQNFPVIISDGSGGAVITWRDFRNNNDWDIYVQRVSGIGQW